MRVNDNIFFEGDLFPITLLEKASESSTEIISEFGDAIVLELKLLITGRVQLPDGIKVNEYQILPKRHCFLR